MGCFAPGCKSGNSHRVNCHLMKISRKATDETRRAWLQNIPKRQGKAFNLDDNHLCHKHFEEQCVITKFTVLMGTVIVKEEPRSHWKLTVDAIPTIFSSEKVSKYLNQTLSNNGDAALEGRLKCEGMEDLKRRAGPGRTPTALPKSVRALQKTAIKSANVRKKRKCALNLSVPVSATTGRGRGRGRPKKITGPSPSSSSSCIILNSSPETPDPKPVKQHSLDSQKSPVGVPGRGHPKKVIQTSISVPEPDILTRPSLNIQKSPFGVPSRGHPKKATPVSYSIPKSYYPIDTKGICILCYRERIVLNAKPVSTIEQQQFSAKFCTLLLRHLKLGLQQNIIPAGASLRLKKCKKVSIVLCEDCSLLARTFCNLYFELENARLKLDACVNNLTEIVRIAGRIPSRMKTYQERMGIETETPAAISAGKQPAVGTGIYPNGPSKKKAMVALANNFRREVLCQAIKTRSNTFPRVNLGIVEKIGPEGIGGACCVNVSSVCTTTPENKAELVLQRLQNFILAYTISFTSVWLLAMLGDANQLNSNSDPIDNSTIEIDVEPRLIPSISPRMNPTLLESIGGESEPQQPSSETTNDKESPQEDQNQTRNTITITDSGKTVLLPHQVFKTDDTFVDESLMEYEDNGDVVDLAKSEGDSFSSTDDGALIVPSESDMDVPVQEAVAVKVETEPQEAIIDLNDRTCRECKINLSCRAELEKHRVVIHKSQYYVECPVCKQMLFNYDYLTRHRNTFEQCAIAGADEVREFETIAKPIFPDNPTVRGNKFCPMEGCFEVFLKDENLKLHLKSHGSFSCSYCKDNKQFDKAHDLALHEAKEHFGSSSCFGYKCSRCDFHVGNQSNFILHFLDVHLKIEVFQERCEICSKGFFSATPKTRNSERKEVHYATHHDIKGKNPASTFICEHCQAPFLRKAQLCEHEVQIHHLPRKKVKCSICGLELVNSTVVEKHKLSVHSNMPEYEMEAQWKLNRIQQRQTQSQKSKNKFICGCGKVFLNKYCLQTHVVKTHERVNLTPKHNQNGQGENFADDNRQQGHVQMEGTESQM